MSKLANELQAARRAVGLTQCEVAERAGLNRMSVQKLEAGSIDPRLSTLEVLARALGMEIMLVPAALRTELEGFVQSGGKIVGQPQGVAAPESVVGTLLRRAESPQGRR